MSSFSFSLSLSGYFFGAQRPSEFTFLPGLLRPSREGALCLHPPERAPEASVNRARPVPGALLAFCVNQGISASFSPLLSYHRLQTTRFWFVKGLQHTTKNFIWCVSTGFLYSKSHWTCRLSQQVRSVKYNIEWKSHAVWNQWVWLWALDLSLIS